MFKLFRTRKKCPRCLGKGNVDWDDIKRLNRELKWIPGMCAYCNGMGKVDPKIENDIPVDTTYLTLDLSKEERESLLKGDPATLKRANLHDIQVDAFIKKIEYLHFDCNLNSEQIANFYHISETKKESGNEKKELIDYVDRIIQKRKNSY